ncbi:hypothetical protein [Celeribacter sp.]|uniref:hypothetical protein n=1 Tax=Celeribacter sp. TaxID=1890673 RepID=UPI003A95CE4A
MTKKTDREIDQIVDTLVGDHDVAEKLKAKLHEAGQHATPLKVVVADDSAEAEDDLWDNLPV